YNKSSTSHALAKDVSRGTPEAEAATQSTKPLLALDESYARCSRDFHSKSRSHDPPSFFPTITFSTDAPGHGGQLEQSGGVNREALAGLGLSTLIRGWFEVDSRLIDAEAWRRTGRFHRCRRSALRPRSPRQRTSS